MDSETTVRARVRLARLQGLMNGELLHALRNPVSTMSTSLDLLATGNLGDEDRAQLDGVVAREVKKLIAKMTMAGEFTKLARMEDGPVDFAAIVRERIATASERTEGQRVRIETRGLDTALTVTGDARLLGEAVDALLVNALEATAKGGVITVSIEQGETTVFRVQDDGTGIATHVLPNVFRMFYTTRKGANGMGLTMARAVFVAHGGDVRVRSEGEAKGTAVDVVLERG